MARPLILPVFTLLLSACGSSWSPRDVDGDGYSPLEGDCWDAIEGPAGSGLKGADFFPGAAETWYDGFDQDCGGDDDYDADGDGFVPDAWSDMSDLPAGDCWDLPDDMPAEFTVVSSSLTDKNGGVLDWAQPAASEVNPDAADTWYDGVDQDCDGTDDFDQDGDGFRTEAYPDQSGDYGDDCIDLSDLDDENIAGTAAQQVNPDATETWYDGTDQNCDDNDCDKDGDGFDFDGSELCERQECDDDDPDAFPNGDPEWVWYDGQDNNCDGNEGDQDGDGYWVADYAERVAASGSGYDPQTVPTGFGGDCWDVPLAAEDAPEEYQAINGFTQPDAGDVNPAATDAWYDAVDQDCAGGDDFDQDADGYQIDAYADREGVVGTDCDDENGSVNPGYIENWYDGTDQDCDGNDGDADGDGYWHADYDSLVTGSGGTPLDVPEDCGYDGLSSCEGDCNDGNADVHPDRVEDCATADDDDCDGDTNEDLLASEDAYDCTVYYYDGDSDGFGSTAAYGSRCLCEADAAAEYDSLNSDDCDDGRAATNPAATEYCDGHDDDCDGTTDEDDADDAPTWYEDADTDTFGNPSVTDVQCYQPSGYVLDNTDCDDARAQSNPSATEYCNGYDDDCDGTTDENDADDAITWYRDADSDTFGNVSTTLVRCYVPTGYVGAQDYDGDGTDDFDCDDSDSGDYPGATEIVGNEDDEDCDGVEVCYDDDDDDGYLDTSGDTRVSSDVDCADTYEGLATDPFTDCDDTDPLDHPGATETVGNQDDEDCDGMEICYQDADDDGYLVSSPSTRVSNDVDCTDQYEGTDTDPMTDCDDASAEDHPGATETVGNGDDEDCDGTEICYVDADNDGYRTSSTLTSTDTDCSDSGEALSSAGIDCLDSNANAFPGVAAHDSATACMEDADGDDYGDISPPSGVTAGTDCDDASASDYPGATETVADGDDDDCDGVDSCYQDLDGDNYGTSTVVDGSSLDCTSGTGAPVATDCDDSDPDDYPGATETVGNGDDEDCDGGEICYYDVDNDGYLSASPGTRTSTDSDCDDTYEGLATDPFTDCDDSDADDHPGATETVGNEDDEDCDGVEWCYVDADDDGYLPSSPGTAASADMDCTDATEGLATDPFTDCDDSDADDHPGATETVANGDDEDCDGHEICYVDADDDGYLPSSPSTGTSSDSDCSDPNEGLATDPMTDCDDSDAGDHPGATEIVGNEDDEDCDGGEICYNDADNDGFLAASPGTRTSLDTDCTDAYEGTLSDPFTDCDDSSASDYPGAPETVANGDDEDCDGADLCYMDSDLDGYGSTSTVSAPDLDCADAGESSLNTDCDDGDGAQYPGAAEYCNGEDDDCDGTTDEDDAVDVATWYADTDSDGYGDPLVSDLACSAPTSYVSNDQDCDDTDPTMHPGADEYCNGSDDDCDGSTDEDGAVDGTTYYADADSDGYGDPSSTLTSCSSAPSGYLSDDSDCLDSSDITYPGAIEICGDGYGNDCDEATGGTSISDDCPAVGDLVITEIMPNPGLTTDPTGEWFEITNVSSSSYDLEGLFVSDNAADVQIDQSLVLGPDEVAVFARGTSPLRWEDFVYGSISLSNTSDLITIATSADATPASTDIDTVSWSASWPFGAGIAMALDTAHYDASGNDSSTSWAEATCMYDMDLATSPYYEYGTPGGQNDLDCPVIEALDPSELALSTTPTVILTGTGIDLGPDDVVVTVGTWGTDAELTTSVTSEYTLEFTAPSETTEGPRDVVLYNGINLAILEDALNYVDTSAAYIWWPIPLDHSAYGYDVEIPADDATTVTFYGRVDRTGLLHYCDGTEPTAISAEFGVGDAGTDPRYDASWTWSAATFNSGASCSSPQNEYMYELGPFTTGDEGSYSHTFRYSYYGGPWVYGEYRDDITTSESGYTVGDVLDLSEVGSFTVIP